MWVDDAAPCEIDMSSLLAKISARDVVVVNDTKVSKRRIFAKRNNGEEFEILFVRSKESLLWEVLCPSSRLKKDEVLYLTGDLTAEIVAKGVPQVLKLSQPIDEDYFYRNGEMPLPPYIQQVRSSRHCLDDDENWYQTIFAKVPGSQAAPTASLHFKPHHLETIKNTGALLKTVTLHVGLGTFLPVTAGNLTEHIMHSEEIEVPKDTWSALSRCKEEGGKVWAIGTTVLRSLESVAKGMLIESETAFRGSSDLFIYGNYNFETADYLVTNFHQPKSTLLALVCSFAGHKDTLAAYSWAIERKFRLFSYGDMTVWRCKR